MGGWHYRLFKVIPKNKKHKPYYCVKEYFPRVPVGKYLGKREKTVPLWTGGSIEVMGESKKDVIQALKWMLKDVRHYKTKVIREEEDEKE